MPKPKHIIAAKSTITGSSMIFAEFFDFESGVQGKLNESIDKIVLKDGRVIKPDGVFFSMVKNDPEKHKAYGDGADQIKF